MPEKDAEGFTYTEKRSVCPAPPMILIAKSPPMSRQTLARFDRLIAEAKQTHAQARQDHAAFLEYRGLTRVINRLWVSLFTGPKMISWERTRAKGTVIFNGRPLRVELSFEDRVRRAPGYDTERSIRAPLVMTHTDTGEVFEHQILKYSTADGPSRCRPPLGHLRRINAGKAARAFMQEHHPGLHARVWPKEDEESPAAGSDKSNQEKPAQAEEV